MTPRTHEIQGGGGVRLHVRAFGPEAGRPILFLHGWSQMHLCWTKQIESALAEEFQLICPDLRGHGASERPVQPEAYGDGALWAEDVAAILGALELERPVVVAWSMAGWVLGDYLRIHGDAALGGIVPVGAIYRGGALADAEIQARVKPDASGAALLSADQAKALTGTVNFVKACFAGPGGKRDMALMAAWTALCPVETRRACIKRDVDFNAEYAAVTCPALVIHGKADRVVPEATGAALAACIPGAALERYGAGH
ncbi:MAG: alpha/beta hydrolase, partial [Pseudomonadota bacterium]